MSTHDHATQSSCSSAPESSSGSFVLNEDYAEDIYKQCQYWYEQPFLKLVQEAGRVHRGYWPEGDIQHSMLLSIKTGHCPEDCSYCPQSARYKTGIETHALMAVNDILEKAQQAKDRGASRFCLGAAWRTPPRGPQFDTVLEAIKGIKDLGMESCVTLGMLSSEQAEKLKGAGLDYYNHNVDSSKDFYSEIITTRQFSQRVQTLRHLREQGINVCCGGIVGMGETADDRIKFIAFLASMDPHPESVPINFLVKVPGTPLADQADVDVLEFIRVIAVSRIMMPKTRVRLSAGRMGMNREAQILALVAGANSIFIGDELLTTPQPGHDFDQKLLDDVTKPVSLRTASA